MIPTHVEFVVIQLVYTPKQRKHVMMTRRRDTPSGTISEANDWYYQTLYKERSALEPDTTLRFREWRIFSGIQHIFTVHNKVYDQIYIFLGVETCHWVFCKKGSSATVEGQMEVPFSYCGCCIYSQYPKIVEVVRSESNK